MEIALYSRIDSRYRSYFKVNYGDILQRNPGIFSLPPFLYSYWLSKNKVKINGARKISMYMSEFKDQIRSVPRSVSTTIKEYNCYIDFEQLISIENDIDKQLIILDRMHESILKMAQEYGWNKDVFDEIYRRTHENIKNSIIPEDFWNINTWLYK
jgi:hypothetical protein